MADQTNTPSSPSGSSQGSTNTFIKGMMKDTNDSFVQEGMWSHARNGVNNSHDGNTYVIGNEPSNLKCITLPAKMIGCIHLQDDQWLIFSTDDVHSYVGIFDESACTYSPLKNNNPPPHIPIQDINFDCLNLKTTNLITGVFRKRYDCERLVYWDDGLNPTRTMDVDNVPTTKTFVVNGTCTTSYDTIYADCEGMRIASLVQHPCISIAKGKLPGTLPNGSYQACIAYTIKELRMTDYIGLTEVQGLWSHENTSSSLDITITDIDSSFNEFELVILANINAQTVAKRIGYYDTSKGHIHVDRWDVEYTTIPVGDIVFRSEPIEKSDSMYSVNNYLLRVGTYSKYKFNYQPLANQILTKWVSVEYPKNYYQQGGNIVGYLRDEVYAFFIRFVYNTGEFSESYHIPGRFLVQGTDDVQIANADSYTGPAPAWQVYNTAQVNSGFSPYTLADGVGTAIAEGRMGYWESDESYPSTRADIWNSFPGTQGHPLNLCGQPIRHHKMPDETVDPRLDLYNSTSDSIRILGVKFDNIQPPVDQNGNVITSIVGYEILRGSREGNKTIIAKGLINNMRDYTIPGSGNRGLFVNYPYNDLRTDGYLLDGGTRPTGYNAPDDGSAYGGSLMSSYKQDIFSFHSPDTTFSKPYLNGAELKLYSEHVGTSTGSFEVPYKHPKTKVPTAFAGFILNIFGLMNSIDDIINGFSEAGGVSTGNSIQFTGTEELPLEFGYSFPQWPNKPDFAGSDAYGVESVLANIASYVMYVLLIAAFIAVTAAMILLTQALADAKTQKIFDIFYALIPKRDFAAQYTSHGFYDHYSGVTQGNTRRQIILQNYIGGGVQQFGTSYQINNVNRGAGDIAIQINGTIQPTTNPDNSRFTTGEVGCGYNDLIESPIASYYGALRIPMASQYGQLESIKQIPISTCITSIVDTSTGNQPLFGGDIYINRFTQKNTMFFFSNWLVDQPDMYEFNYCNYINIPYPKYWINSEYWKYHVLNSPTIQRSLDNRDAGSISTGDLYLESGYFYLFNSGVRDFFCEAEVNLAYRDYEITDVTKRFYDPYGFASIKGETSMFKSEPNIITSGNYYKYDYSLSKSKLLNSHISWGETLPRDYDPYVAATCYVYRPNRVIYSLPQQDTSKKDNWRAFLTNNFKDFASKVSCIKPIHKTGSLFMMKYANPLMFMGVEELKLSDSGTKVTIGDGGLFTGVQQLQAVVHSDESYEYGSNQGRFCSINCVHGVFWVSQNQGKVFHYSGQGLQEISAGGMRWWFAKYLPSQLLKVYPDYPLYDNPVAGVGVQMIYDNTHELIYITKKDYLPKVGGLSFDSNGKFYRTINGIKTFVDLTDTTVFDNASWTISYDPKIKAFVSFHDWIPSFLIPGKAHFMSVASEVASKVDSIWKHNIRCDSYCNFYGVDYPFEIEFISATSQAVNSMRSIEYLLEVYNYSNDCRDKFHNFYENFDQAIVYNSEQMSGLLKLNLHVKNDPLALLAYPQVNTALGYIDIQYSKVEQKYRFNQFWDITKDRGQALPSPLNIPMFNIAPNGYIYPINPAYVNYSKNPLEHKKFRHNVNKVFLRRLVSGSNKFLFKLSNQKTLQSPR